MHSDDMFAPVALLNITKCHLEEKVQQTTTINVRKLLSALTRPSVSSIYEFQPMELDMTFSRHACSYRRQLAVSGIAVPSFEMSLEAEVRTVFQQLVATLYQHHLTLSDVFFVHVYVNDMNDFKAINDVYCSYFGSHPPSRSCVQIHLPPGQRVVIDCFAQEVIAISCGLKLISFFCRKAGNINYPIQTCEMCCMFKVSQNGLPFASDRIAKPMWYGITLNLALFLFKCIRCKMD